MLSWDVADTSGRGQLKWCQHTYSIITQGLDIVTDLVNMVTDNNDDQDFYNRLCVVVVQLSVLCVVQDHEK